MAKAIYNRDGQGGYRATYGGKDDPLTAVFAKDTNGSWFVTDGFGDHLKPEKKISDLKAAWQKACAASREAEVQKRLFPGPPPIPGLKPPPPMPGMKAPPPIKPPVSDRATPPPTLAVAQGAEPNQPVAFEDFERFLVQQGKLAGPCRNDFVRCPECRRHEALWEKDDDGVVRPPCRCGQREINPADYYPDSLDPRMHGRSNNGAVRTLTPIGALDRVYQWMQHHPDYCSAGGKLVEPFASVRKVLWDSTGYAEFRPEVWG